MMRTPMAKTGVLALVLVLCLATIGMGFAKWSDHLTVDGTVDTGSVAVEFAKCKSNDAMLTNVTSLDPVSGGSWNFGEVGFDIEDPDTWVWTGDTAVWDEAHTDAKIDSVDGDTNNRLSIKMGGGYPGYSPNVAYTIENTGTIPVKVESIKLIEVSKNGLWDTSIDIDLVAGVTQYVYVVLVEGSPGNWTAMGNVSDTIQKDAENNVISEFSLTLSTLALGQQIDPTPSVGPGITAIPGDLCFRVEQGAAISTTYDFLIEVSVCQWNEYS